MFQRWLRWIYCHMLCLWFSYWQKRNFFVVVFCILNLMCRDIHFNCHPRPITNWIYQPSYSVQDLLPASELCLEDVLILEQKSFLNHWNHILKASFFPKCALCHLQSVSMKNFLHNHLIRFDSSLKVILHFW